LSKIRHEITSHFATAGKTRGEIKVVEGE